MATNGDFGFTVQKIICDIYGLTPNNNAKKQFEAAYNEEVCNDINPVIDEIFRKLGSSPVQCTTYEKSENKKERFSPHNFILANGMTLSIKTTKKSNMVAPRVVGQSGINTFNNHFSDIIGYEVKNKEEIKKAVVEKTDEMLPVFLDYLFISDYTVWIHKKKGQYLYEIFDRNMIVDISTEIENFTFTQTLESWTECMSMSYQGTSLASVQIHKNRTFKFRFNMNNLLKFISVQVKTNETLGISAEAAVCSAFDIEIPESYKSRLSAETMRALNPLIADAFQQLPAAIKSTGSEQGSRGKNSKCSYDFVLDGEKTLSLKTNTGKKVCPPEVGQPGAETCYLYFGHLTTEKVITNDVFKEMVLNNIEKMFPIYLDYMFEADYMLWIYKRKKVFHYKVFNSDFAKKMSWDYSKFTFTKSTVEAWNGSTTLKYDGVSIGEFQVHKSRSCFKFRFNMENLEKVIKSYEQG